MIALLDIGWVFLLVSLGALALIGLVVVLVVQRRDEKRRIAAFRGGCPMPPRVELGGRPVLVEVDEIGFDEFPVKPFDQEKNAA